MKEKRTTFSFVVFSFDQELALLDLLSNGSILLEKCDSSFIEKRSSIA